MTTDDLIPEKIGKYPIRRILGKGGMGIVYLGYDSGMDREVAIKTLRQDVPDELKKRFDSEGKAGKLQHENIVIVYETGSWGRDFPYIAMEYIDGEPLDKLVASKRSIPLGEKLEIIRQVCVGLHYAHEHGVLHRDIKPANVIKPGDKDKKVKIVDFGIAKIQSLDMTGVTGQSQVIGTVAYMAPERLKGERVDRRVDVFACGVMLYFLLTGEEPFKGEEIGSVIHKIVSEAHPPLKWSLAGYPPELDEILERALAKSVDDRYSTAQEFADDLAAVIDGLNRGRVSGLLEDARRLRDQGQFDLAADKCQEVLKIEPQNTEAFDIRRSVKERLRAQATEERVLALQSKVEDSLAKKQYEEAVETLKELLRLRPGNLEFQQRLEYAEGKRKKRKQVDSSLNECQALLKSGDLTGAFRLSTKLFDENPDDLSVLEAYSAIAKRVREQEERTKVDRHVENARQKLAAQQYTDAIAILEDVLKSKISPPDVDRLYQEALRGRKQQETERLREQAITQVRKLKLAEHYAEALTEINRYLEGPLRGDITLLRLKQEIEREATKSELKGWIADTVDHVLSLALTSIEDALTALRKAMERLPGEERFESLESALLLRQREAGNEQRRANCLRESGDALVGGNPDLAIKTIESYLLEFQSDTDIDDLLQDARRALEEKDRKRRISECTARSRMLIDESRFDEAIDLLGPVVTETQDRALATLLDRAEQGKADVDGRVRLLAKRISELRQAGKVDEAVALIENQSAALLRNSALQEILTRLREELRRNEANARAELERSESLAESIAKARRLFDQGDWIAAREPFETLQRVYGAFPALTQAMSEFDRNRTQVSDARVDKSVADAKAALLSGDKNMARKALKTGAVLLTFATPTVAKEWERLAKGFKVELPAPGPNLPTSKFPIWTIAVVCLIFAAAGVTVYFKLTTSHRTSLSIIVSQPNDDGTTKPIADAQVEIDPDTPMATKPTSTNAEGKAIVDVKPGHHVIRVTKSGFTKSSPEIDVVEGANSFLASISPSGTTGTLTVSGNVDKFNIFYGKTSAKEDLFGTYVKGQRIDLPAGDGWVRYEANDFLPSKDKPITITRGGEVKDEFNLKPKSTGPHIEEFKSDSSTIPAGGGSITLHWRTENVASLFIDPGVGKVTPVDRGSTNPIAVSQDTAYTLTAIGNDNTKQTRTWRVTVLRPGSAGGSLSVRPTSAKPGESVVLSWVTNDAMTVSIDHGIGQQPPNAIGTKTVVIPKDAANPYAYHLTATGRNGQPVTYPAEIDIQLPPPPQPAAPAEIPSFKADSPSVEAGKSTTLRWETKNAKSVQIDGVGSVDPSGHKDVFPSQETTYRLTAIGEDGKEVSAIANVKVAAGGTSPAKSTVPDRATLGPVLTSMQSIFSQASVKKASDCKAALSKLPASKSVLEGLQQWCGDKTFAGHYACDGSPTGDDREATWTCTETVSISGQSPVDYKKSTFTFLKSADGAWRVVKWDWHE